MMPDEHPPLVFVGHAENEARKPKRTPEIKMSLKTKPGTRST